MNGTFEAALKKHDEAQSAFVRGDASRIKALWSEAQDVSLFGAMGSYARGWDEVARRLEWAAGQFSPPASGQTNWKREPISIHVGTVLAISVHLERFRARVAVAGGERYIEIRATLIWRRDPDGWRITHRHGDALMANHDP